MRPVWNDDERRLRTPGMNAGRSCDTIRGAGARTVRRGRDLTDSGTITPAGRSPAGAETDALFAAVYERLKVMAGRRLREAAGDTLGTTALVHDLYLRMSANPALEFAHPAQFFSYAARAMRHLLVDRARNRSSQRAGGGWKRITLTASDDELVLESAARALALDAALNRLAEADQRAADVVELVYFAGLTLEQAAQTLGVAQRTVDRDWQFARAFLRGGLE